MLDASRRLSKDSHAERGTTSSNRAQRLLAVAALVPATLLVLAAVLAALLPGRIDRATLNDSVAARVSDATQGSGYTASCRPARNATWRCVFMTTELSDTGVTHRVVISEDCWTGILVRTGGMLGLPRRPSDCIHLLDQLTD